MMSTWQCGSAPARGPRLRSIKLYDEELVPVCSPAFRRRRLPRAHRRPPQNAASHDERQPWSIWFKAVGLDYRDARQRQRYGDQTLCCLRPPLRASVSPWRVHRSSQRTWNPAGWFGFFPGSVPRDTRTSSCIRPAPSRLGKIQVFQEWLLEQVRPVERKDAILAQAG